MIAQPPPQLCLCGCGQETEVNWSTGERYRYLPRHAKGNMDVRLPPKPSFGDDAWQQKAQGVRDWVQKRDLITQNQVTALAKRFDLSAADVRGIIQQARLKLAHNADKYVEAHIRSVEESLELQTAQGYAVAQKGAEWALERIAEGGDRVLDQPKVQAHTGTQILIGVQMGGIGSAGQPVVQAQTIEGEIVPVLPAQPAPPPKKARRDVTGMETQVAKLLAAVTPDTAQAITRAIIDVGLSAKTAWEMVKEMLVVNSHDRVMHYDKANRKRKPTETLSKKG